MLKSPSEKLPIEASELYEPLWLSPKRYIISIGGRGGARSFENSQNIVAKLKQTTRKFRAAIMRAVHQDIRHSIWQECVDRVEQYGLEHEIHIVDSVMEMTCGVNSINAHGFKRSSHERTAKLKSLAGYTDAYIEEAEEIGEADFQQLDDSLRAAGSQIHLMLNTPARSHWIVKRWFNLEPVAEAPGYYRLVLKPEYAGEVEVIFSDHFCNPYLAEEVHVRYESYRTTKPDYYWQMIRGFSPEVVMGRIYKGWREIDAVPHEARFLGSGLDFGFDPDPAAYLDVYWHNGGIILDEQIYATGLTNPALARSIKLLPQKGPIVADSAEPKSIQELKDEGIHVIAASKGPDSVNFGIKHMQGLRISYTKRSVNLKYEYENYAWKRNKDATEENDHLGIEDPNCPNHLMSAARYFCVELVKADADPEAEERVAAQIANRRREGDAARRADTGM